MSDRFEEEREVIAKHGDSIDADPEEDGIEAMMQEFGDRTRGTNPKDVHSPIDDGMGAMQVD